MTHGRLCGFVTFVFAMLLAAPLGAQLTPYSQDFETLELGNPDALADDGWVVFGNVFWPWWEYWYGYGVFTAPNNGEAFSELISGAGGPQQGDHQLRIFNDYNNAGHTDGTRVYIESNVFQEQIITTADVGSTWLFEFDAKRGDIGGLSTAAAFFKTILLEPCCSLTNYVPLDVTTIPDTWDRYSIEYEIGPELVGQALQFGFLNVASGGEFSGMLYDNINFDRAPIAVDLDIKPGSCPNPINPRSRGLTPVAILGSADFDVSQIDVATVKLAGVAPFLSSYEDVAGPFDGDLCGCTTNGADGFTDLALKFVTQDLVNANGDGVLMVTGSLLDGTPIEGGDCVLLVGAGSGPPNHQTEFTQIDFPDAQPESGMNVMRNTGETSRSTRSRAHRR